MKNHGDKMEDNFWETLLMMDMLEDEQQHEPPRKKKGTNWTLLFIAMAVLALLSILFEH